MTSCIFSYYKMLNSYSKWKTFIYYLIKIPQIDPKIKLNYSIFLLRTKKGLSQGWNIRGRADEGTDCEGPPCNDTKFTHLSKKYILAYVNLKTNSTNYHWNKTVTIERAPISQDSCENSIW